MQDGYISIPNTILVRRIIPMLAADGMILGLMEAVKILL
jgi:hypothetical protein